MNNTTTHWTGAPDVYVSSRASSLCTAFIGPRGMLKWAAPWELPTYIGAAGQVKVPQEVDARAGRLFLKYGRARGEYLCEWGERELERAYKAGQQRS